MFFDAKDGVDTKYDLLYQLLFEDSEARKRAMEVQQEMAQENLGNIKKI